MVESIAFHMSDYWCHGARSILHVGDFLGGEEGHRLYKNLMEVQSRCKRICVHPIRGDLKYLVRIMTGKDPISPFDP
jgi:hypothetical protein